MIFGISFFESRFFINILLLILYKKMFKIDTNRTARCGFPEVIYGSGKTAAQVADIMMAMIQAGSWPIIASRINEEKALNISNLINEKTVLKDKKIAFKKEFYRRANILHFIKNDDYSNNDSNINFYKNSSSSSSSSCSSSSSSSEV